METTQSGQCFRINPNGKLWGKGGDYGKIQVRFFPCVSLSGEAAKKTKQWLAMETKSTCILRSGKGGTKRHAFSDRTVDRKIFNKKIYEGARIY